MNLVPTQLVRRDPTTSPCREAIKDSLTRKEAVEPRSPYQLSGLMPPDALKGLGEAVDCLTAAIRNNASILIVGDYDADGATSAAVMMQGLALLGARSVDYLIPNRFDMGYGLSPTLAELALSKDPDLIITVDQGINSVEGVQRVINAGRSIIVTDHHLPGKVLPNANAIVNPNQKGCRFPCKTLAGVGVAFYLLIGLRAALVKDGTLRRPPNLAQLLDLVALGTIADLVPLDDNNRRLVQAGVDRIRRGQTRPGILALIAVAGLDPTVITARQLAFNIAPRLNAAGRLEEMSAGVACLLADADGALKQAQLLDQYNRSRREIEETMREQAEDLLGALPDDELASLMGISLIEEDWHEGVVGIVAARVRARYHRPVFAFAQSKSGLIKGSGRSVEGLHLRDVLALIDADQQGLLVSYGGHAMAAGVTLRAEDFTVFARQFNAFVDEALEGKLTTNEIVSEGLVPTMDLGFAASLVRDHPWGQGFPEPLFDEQFEVLEQRRLKGGHLKMQLFSKRLGQAVDAIYFGRDQEVESYQARFAFRLDVNRYRGVDRVQLQIQNVWS